MPPRTLSLPIRFDGGMVTLEESSALGEGQSPLLENWIPSLAGGLRCRRGWRRASTEGVPSTRKVRGIGTLVLQASAETPTRRQDTSTSVGAATSLGRAWTQATLAGSLLIAVVVVYRSAGAPSITPPADWVATTDQTYDAGKGLIRVYYIEGAAARSGTETFSVSASSEIHLYLQEYTGIKLSAALDQQAGTSGTGTTADSGTTAATTQAEELWFGVHAAAPTVINFTSPTNGFAQIRERDETSTTAVYEKIVAATGTARVQATISASRAWGGKIVTFKAIAQPFTGGRHVVAHEDTAGAEQELYAINRDALESSAFSLIEAVANSTPANPVAFASGLGQILSSSIGYPSNQIRRWDGTTAATIAGSPAGRALAFHKNRFFSAGTAANPTRLWFSDQGSYTSWPGASFIDVLQDDGEPIEDLAPVLGGLLIAKANSLHFLSGDGASNFSLDRLVGGGGAPGRCIIPSPFGVVVAALTKVYLWRGGAVETISDAIDDSYAIDGEFCSGAYANGVAYICDEGTGTIYAYDLRRQIWWTEHVTGSLRDPAVLFGHRQFLLYGPKNASSVVSLLQFREEPGGVRARDQALGMDYVAETPELWLGDGRSPVTPKHLWLQLRQRGGVITEAPLQVSATYDGEAQLARDVPLREGAGTYRERVDIGDGRAHFSVKLRLEQHLSSSQDSLLDIERAELEVIPETPR